MQARIATAVLTGIVTFAGQAAEAPGQATAPAVESRAVMTGDQVVQILDETVDWYRTLGAQQQAATQPSDLLILYANRQTADKVVALAFEIARANAELLSSEAGVKKEADDAASAQSLGRLRKKLDERRTALQAETEATRRQLASAPKTERAALESRISVLLAQLELVNARRNMVSNMSQFESETDTTGFGANALKAHIDAIAASIPAASGTPTPVTTASAPAPAATAGTSPAAAGTLSRFGIWDLAATVFRLSSKAGTIKQADERTAQLEETFRKIRTPPLDQLRRLAERGDQLQAQAESGSDTNFRGMRDQYDTLAWLFQQTSAIVTPLSKAGVLLTQYRRNLDNWRIATERQYREALEALGLRVLLFVALLAFVFGLAHLWRRAVYRYVHEARRRSRLLLLQKVVLWTLVVAIAASTFVTELGSLATFAGLITAGLAVAMQSVLVSIVGYFFLIGKYGIRVGDRVQIGSVTGEVIEMGLVRLHLMELSGEGPMAPTGRVVAFANSIIFQSSGGLFKQIPGVNFAWHEVTFILPSGADYGALKDEMVQAVTRVIADYREDIVRQTREIQKAASSHESGDPQPSVQLRFSAASVDAIVRYPVQLSHAAEIDEQVSRELLNVLSAHASAAA
ncbi:MAG TPA: mechanosensitive ion channel domain-containing protein [Steroidobacteraceae bacterium]|nr:mechanosensitive ion channel domain-containing protein [Steroidobacteraceae bacterium]